MKCNYKIRAAAFVWPRGRRCSRLHDNVASPINDAPRQPSSPTGAAGANGALRLTTPFAHSDNERHVPHRMRLSQICFERAVGFGLGDWDYIVEENVDDVMALFAEVVRYCVTLPDRIRAEAG